MDKKQRVLDAAKLILDAKPDVIDILKKNSVSQINTIDRNSKSIKDPDPLSSTMCNISLKYPITVVSSSVKKFVIPTHLLMNSYDLRKYNRIPCKMETISWYISHAAEPPKNVKEVIKGLFKNPTKKLDAINNMNWGNLTFKMANVDFNRRQIATNPMEIKIPKHMQAPLLSKVLNIDNFIEYESVPQDMIDHVKNILMNNNTLPYRSIPNIIHFLSSEIDEKYRFLPIIPGMNHHFLLVSHVLVQPRYAAQEIGDFIALGHRKNEILTQVCINLLHYAQTNGSYIKMRQKVTTVRIGGLPMMGMLDDTYENMYIKGIKGVLGKPITSMVIYSTTKFYPQKTKLISIDQMNPNGVKFTTFVGQEKVYFATDNIKGYFIHNGEALSKIMINRCTPSIVKKCLTHISVFCMKEFNVIKAPTFKTLQERAAILWTQKLHDVIGVSSKQFVDFLKTMNDSDSDKRIGIFTITKDIDFEETVESNLILVGNQLYTKDKQLFATVPIVKKWSSWDPKITLSEEDFDLWLYDSPPVLLLKMIRMLHSHSRTLITNVKMGTWYNRSDIIKTHVIPRMRAGISLRCRELCKGIVNSPTIDYIKLATYYSFTNLGEIRAETVRKFNTFLFGDMKINLSLLTGDLVYHMVEGGRNNLYLRDKLICTEHSESIVGNTCFIGLAPDIELRLIRHKIPSLKYRPYYWIARNSNNIAEGTSYITNLRGQYYRATKNNLLASQIDDTLMRCLAVDEEPIIHQDFRAYLKRKRENDLMSVVDPSEVLEKRCKLSVGAQS